MREEQVPEVVRECGRQISNDGKEVGFEGLDGLFGGIAAVDVRRDELVLCVPFVFDVCFESLLALLLRIWRSTVRPRLVRRCMMEL